MADVEDHGHEEGQVRLLDATHQVDDAQHVVVVQLLLNVGRVPKAIPNRRQQQATDQPPLLVVSTSRHFEATTQDLLQATV